MDDFEIDMTLVEPMAAALIDAVGGENGTEMQAALEMLAGSMNNGLLCWVAYELAQQAGPAAAEGWRQARPSLITDPMLRDYADLTMDLYDAAHADGDFLDASENWEEASFGARLAVLMNLASAAAMARRRGL